MPDLHPPPAPPRRPGCPGLRRDTFSDKHSRPQPLGVLMTATAVDTAFAALRTARPGYTPWCGFVVQGENATAVYTLEPSDRPDLPGTHKLTGNHGPVYGYWSEVSGRSVPIRRSGWCGARGVLGTFDTRDAPNADPTMRVKGWAVIHTA